MTGTAIPRRFAPIALVGALVPAVASASNMTHPRTPVTWEGTPCLTLHDRSEDPIFHLEYGIPFEDLDVTPDEVPGSRRHQFFAYCRPHHPQDFLPTWITQADVDAAVAAELVGEGVVETSDILEFSEHWADCWFRINGDDERRPISNAMAEAGVEWDTSAVPAGVYTLNGYTYEPVFNIWTLRPGVMKIHDGDPHAIGPAAAISTGELTPYRDDEVMIEGCAHALPGSTFTAYWAVTPMPNVESRLDRVRRRPGALGRGLRVRLHAARAPVGRVRPHPRRRVRPGGPHVYGVPGRQHAGHQLRQPGLVRSGRQLHRQPLRRDHGRRRLHRRQRR